ncbi:MAG: hypothetical protein Aurels2KO_23620 [Aureliella sp.]
MSKRPASTMKMHETAALLLCRAAFVALGFAPVVLVLFWAFAELVPAYRNARTSRWESTLGSVIGVSVEIGSVQHVAPKRFRLDNIQLSHPETQLPIAQLASATVLQVGENWFVRCASGQVSLVEMPQLWNVTHDWVLCRPGQLSGEVVVSFDELLVDGDRGQTAFGPSQLSLLPTASEQELQILLGPAKRDSQSLGSAVLDGQVAASEELSPALITVSREVVKGQPQTTISVDSGSTPLPCSLAFGIAPSLRQLGDDATFQGTAAFLQMQRGWGMWINSQPGEKTVVYRDRPTTFSRVNFGRLTDGTEASVRGEGAITLSRVCVADYGVQEAVGAVVVNSQRNSVNATFLKHSCASLGLEHNFDFTGMAPGLIFPFSKLALQFQYLGEQLRLQGGENGLMLFGLDGQARIARRGAQAESDIPVPHVLAALERTAAESPRTTGIVGHRDLSLLARRWLPSYNRSVVSPSGGEHQHVAPRTQTASNNASNIR